MKRLLLLSTLLAGCIPHSAMRCDEPPPNCDPTKPWTCECQDESGGEKSLSFSPPTDDPSGPPDDGGGPSDDDNGGPSDPGNGGPSDPGNGGPSDDDDNGGPSDDDDNGGPSDDDDNGGGSSDDDNGGKTKDDNGHGNDPGKFDPSNPGKGHGKTKLA